MAHVQEESEMKTLTSELAALAMRSSKYLVLFMVIAGLVLASAAAQASFKGVLKQGVQFRVDVDNTGQPPGEKVAITILKINRRDKIGSADHWTIDGGQALPISDTCGTGISRVIIFVNPFAGRVTPITVTQAGVGVFNDPGEGDTQLVFDIE